MGRVYSTSEIARKYNRFSRWYDLSEGVFELFIWRDRRRLLSNVRGKVLEVGVGTGRNLGYYPSGCRITGIDVSGGMLERARKKVARLGVNAVLKKGDVERLPFKNGSFDFVVDTLGLCTYSNPVAVLREMKRVCKDDGRILLLEHGVSDRKWVRNLQERREGRHYESFGCSLLRNHEALVRDAGLKIVRSERRLFGAVYVIVCRK